MRFAILSAAAFAAAVILATPGPSGSANAQPAGATGPSSAPFQAAMRRCRRALPVARRFIGLPQAVVQARYRAPRSLVVRYCAICTRDFRPNRLTFGLDDRGIVRSATCG
ncbi:hypothetical protein [Phreatobacter sp.]|uniref:hypothetical protein n=1 Tax=Phreatobacter sp. TaxID=1966341 RepID=UPI0025F6D6FC|nr:hypothetical protein [Phreatobacter sp.]